MSNQPIKLCVFTAARSDYFLLQPLLKQIQAHPKFELLLIVGGMHTKASFGHSVQLIEQQGLPIYARLHTQGDGLTPQAVVQAMAEELAQHPDLLSELRPDLAMVLGDRYEVFTFALACHIYRIPIAHIHGGELSFGSFDDASRHAISKLAYLHFPATATYRNRIIQMGESPARVFNVGALAVENTQQTPTLCCAQLSEQLNLNLREQFFLVTVHPETDVYVNDLQHIEQLVTALTKFPDYDVLWTISNADPNGHRINQYLATLPHCHLVENLGALYLPVMKQASVVIGNSSSGIIEAPIVGVPTLNLGNRQQGRVRTPSIYDCRWAPDAITQTLAQILARGRDAWGPHPYGEGDTSKKILDTILSFKIESQKKFHDIEWQQTCFA